MMKHRMHALTLALSLLPLAVLAACAGKQEPVTASTLPLGATQLEGTLQSGVVAVGGETSGWLITLDDMRGAIEVDVSKVSTVAMQLQGQRVLISGEVLNKQYVTRGQVKTIAATTIVAAPPRKALPPSVPPPPSPKI